MAGSGSISAPAGSILDEQPVNESEDRCSMCPFAWVGLASRDPVRARVFYADVFGWIGDELHTGAMGAVTIFTLDGHDVAILYSQTPEARAAHVAPHWTPFIAVRSAAASVARAADEGAIVLRDPFAVVDRGWAAALQDPGGAVFSLWQRGARRGATLVNAQNTHCSTVLRTEDLSRAKAFYAATFGWRYDDRSPESTRVIHLPGPRVEMRAREEGDATSDAWLPYFLVESASEVAAKVQACQGAYLGPATGRASALLSDPAGALFAVTERPAEA
jgi:uncharacterized protein